jgi:hypothetical protein
VPEGKSQKAKVKSTQAWLEAGMTNTEYRMTNTEGCLVFDIRYSDFGI